MGGNSETTARKLDVVARSVDLLTTLTNAANSSNGLAVVAFEIGAWLGRERLNQYELQNCFEHAKSLIIPNAQGEAFIEKVIHGISSHAVLPLRVVPSGALGRLLLHDRALCWMASTATCLLQNHGETYTTDAIISFIVNTHAASQHGYLSDQELAWHPLRVQLEPVITKLVSSVWLNVVNSGGKDLEIDPIISELCTHGHHLESHTFGVVINFIKKQPKKIMIWSEYTVSNLLLWLLYHFNGKLRIVVSGKIVRDQKLGPNDHEIELRINNRCKADELCAARALQSSEFSIHTEISGCYKQLFSLSSFQTQNSQQTEPRARRKLYDTDTRYPLEGQMKRNSLGMRVRCTAQMIVRWMLQQPIGPSDSLRLEFTVYLQAPVAKSRSLGILADLLARVPSMLNMQWGEVMADSVVYSAIPLSRIEDDKDLVGNCGTSAMHIGREHDDIAYITHQSRPEDVLMYFPCLEDLLGYASKACQCTYCYMEPIDTRDDSSVESYSSQVSARQSTLKLGCLKYTVFLDVMTLVAHAIADGFGATDVSAVKATNDLDIYETSYLLTLFCESSIHWEHWFLVAAKVFLGHSASTVTLRSTEGAEGLSHGGRVGPFTDVENFGNTTVAVQFGSLAVVAPWIDLSKALHLRGCFGFTIVHGRLCVSTGPDERLQSVEGDFVMIKTQKTNESTGHYDQGQAPAISATKGRPLAIDTSLVESDVILASSDTTTFKLLQRVRSNTHSRLIDPSRAILKIAQSPPVCGACVHFDGGGLHVQSRADMDITVWSFNDLLDRWASNTAVKESSDANTDSSHARPTSVRVMISDTLDSHAKFNVALSLSADEHIVINYSNACFDCCIKTLLQSEKNSLGFKDQIERGRLISIARDLQQVPWMNKRARSRALE
jgi:hypothetical protein